MKRHVGFEGAVLLTLSLLLVTVFMLSVWMYDDLAGVTEEGALAVFAGDVRDFLDGNTAVAVFLGLEKEPEEYTEKRVDRERIEANAAAYIDRYNRLYTDLQ